MPYRQTLSQKLKIERRRARVRTLYEEGLAIGRISSHVGCSHSTVQSDIDALGLKRRWVKMIFDAEARRKEVLALYNSGFSMPEIGVKLKISRQRVEQMLKRTGELETVAARNDRISADYAAGLPYADLCRKHALSKARIVNIIKARNEPLRQPHGKARVFTSLSLSSDVETLRKLDVLRGEASRGAFVRRLIEEAHEKEGHRARASGGEPAG